MNERYFKFGILAAVLFAVSCTPKVGSDAWCNNLMDKPRGEWTAEEVKGVANHCIAT